MRLQTQNLAAYLTPSAVLDAHHPEVRQQTLALTEAIASTTDRARALYEWVRDQITHSWDVQARVVTCSASSVLREGTGICLAKSHLLAALCRAADIPAGLCYQRFRRRPPFQPFGIHGFNAVYLDDADRWVRLDARGNREGINAQFCVDHEQLAFAADPSQGEVVYDTVFAEPDPGVVAFLQRHTDLQTAWPDLPDCLVRD